MKVCINENSFRHYLVKLFIFLLISIISIFLFSFNSFANCINVSATELIFLANGESSCVQNPADRKLVIYNNSDINVDNSKKTDLNTLVEGRGKNGYSLHFTFDRDNAATFATDQTLFALYDDLAGGAANLVAIAGIRSGEFFYKTKNGTDYQEVRMDMSLVSGLNDPEVDDPHVVVIVYDERRQKMILNIDGAELITNSVLPIDTVNKVTHMELGEGYTGKMGIFNIYSTRMSIQERMDLVGILNVVADTKFVKQG